MQPCRIGRQAGIRLWQCHLIRKTKKGQLVALQANFFPFKLIHESILERLRVLDRFWSFVSGKRRAFTYFPSVSVPPFGMRAFLKFQDHPKCGLLNPSYHCQNTPKLRIRFYVAYKRYWLSESYKIHGKNSLISPFRGPLETVRW